MRKKLLLISYFLFLNCLFLSAQSVRQVLPKKNTAHTEERINLEWSAPPNYNQHIIELSQDSSFLIVDYTYNITNTESILSDSLLDGTWYWKIKSISNNDTLFSNVSFFIKINLFELTSLELWLRADTGLSLDGNNRITTWTDLSTNNYIFNQTSTNARPIKEDSVLNNHPSLRFDGNQFFNGGDILNLSNIDRSIFVVGNSNNNSNNGSYFAKSRAAAVPDRFALQAMSNKDVRFLVVSGNSNSSISVPNASIFPDFSLIHNTFYPTNNSLSTQSNSSSIITNTLPNNTNIISNFRFLIGAFNNSNDNGETNHLEGNITEMIFVKNVNVDTVDWVKSYLKEKYFPSVNLGKDVYIYNYGLCDSITIDAGDKHSNYLWSTGDTSSQISVLKEGKYWVEASNIQGFNSSDTIYVYRNDYEKFNQDTTEIICLGDTVILSPVFNSLYDISWNTGFTTNDLIVSQSGEYYYTLTDSFSCTINSDTIVFDIDTFALNISLGTDTSICAGNSISLVSGESEVVNFNWSDGSTNNQINIDTTGLYFIEVTNTNNCVARDSINVNISGIALTPSCEVINNCINDTISFINNTSPASEIANTYWVINQNDTINTLNFDTVFSNSGVYDIQLFIENLGACISDTSFSVEIFDIPQVDFDIPQICINNNARFNSSVTNSVDSIVTYEWLLDNTSVSNGVNLNYSFDSIGNYGLTFIVETNKGCVTDITKNIDVLDSFPIPTSTSLISPNNGSVFSSNDSILFSWNIVNDANLYSFEIYADSNKTQLIFSDTLQNEMLNINLPNLSGIYYWTVNSFNACNQFDINPELRTIRFLDLISFTNIELWLKANEGVDLDTNNRVEYWNDLSLNNYIFSQSNINNKPFIATNQLNGYPSVNFQGNQFLNGGDILNLGNTSKTFFLIVNSLSGADNGSFYAKARAAAVPNRYALLPRTNGDLQFLIRAGTLDRTISIPSYNQYPNFSLVQKTYNTIDNFISVQSNNNTIQTNSIPDNSNIESNNRFLIGAYNNANDNGEQAFLNGNITEFIILNTVNEDTINLFKDYLRYKYSPPVNLGPNKFINSYSFCDSVSIEAESRFVNFLWSTGDTTNEISTNQPGDYWVRVIDIFGYESSDTIKVINNAIDNFNQPNKTLICLGDSLELNINVVNDYDILWNDSVTTSNNLKIFEQGDYFYSLTDSFGCSLESDRFLLVIDSFPIAVSLGADTSLCVGNEVKVAEGDSLIINYLWSNGSNNNNIKVDSTGFYSLEARNLNNCLAKDSVFINIIGEALTPLVTINNNCLNDTIQFTNTTIPNSEIAQTKWIINQDTLINITVDSLFITEGIYQVQMIVEANNSCISDTSFQYEILPSPNANFSFTEICVNNPTLILNNSLTASPSDTLVGSEWKVNGSVVSNDFNLEYTFNNIGTQTVSLEITDQNGCKSTIEQPVEAFGTLPSPSNFTLFYPSNNYYFSPGETVSFNWNDASGVVRYKLSIFDNNTNQLVYLQDSIFGSAINLNTLNNGDYIWNITAFNACGDSIMSNSYQFNIFDPSYNSQLSLWLKADTGLVIDANNRVEQWRDLSPNNHQLNQLINVSKPFIEQSSLNGFPTIRFNGNQFLNGGNILNIGTSSRSMFIVAKSDFSTSSRCFYAKSLAAGSLGRFAFNVSSPNNAVFIYSETLSSNRNTSFTLNNNNLYFLNSAISDRVNSENRLEHNNQIRDLTSINSTTNMQSNFRFLIGAYNNINDNGETNHLNGNIAEMIFIDDADPQSILDIQNYLRYKYSPPINLGPDIKVDYGFCGVDIVADSRFVSYLWNTGDTTATITADYPGEYWVEVVDIFGYTSSDTIQVIRPDYDIFDLQDEIICLNDTTSLTANLIKNYTIEWNTGSTDSTIIITQPGNYFFTAFDTLGCSTNSRIANIEIDSIVNFFSLGADTTLCSGNLIGAASGTQFVQFYLWNTGSNEPEIAVSSPFNYYVTVTSFNGCEASDSIFVDIQGTAPTVVYTYPLEICQEEEFSFSESSFVPSPDIIVNRLWDLGDGTISNNSSGVHSYSLAGIKNASLEITTNTGCSEKLNFDIFVNPKPQVDFVYSNACSEKGTMFNGINNTNNTIVSWEWDFGDANSPNNTASGDVATHQFDNSGFYNVRLVVMDNFGCRDTVEKNIFIFRSPEADFDVNTTCLGDSSFFNSTSFVLPTQSITNYNWNFGNGQNSNLQNPALIYNNIGSYNIRLEINTNLGCKDTIEKTIEVFDVPEALFTLDTICVNSPLVLIDESNYVQGQNSEEVLWTLGNDSLFGSPRTYTFSDTLNYQISLHITDSVGCKDSYSMNKKVHPVPTAAFNISPTLVVIDQEQNFINFSDNENDFFLWNFGDGDFSNDFEPSHIYTDTGEYTIWLTAENPFTCADSTSRKISVFPQALDIAVSNVISNEVNGYYEVIVTLQNLGTTVINAADLIIELPKGRTLSESWQGQIFSGQQTNYQLNTRISKGINLDEIDFICVTALNPNNQLDEINVENNVFCLNQSNQRVNFALPYPNPFNEYINILFFIEESGLVKLSMFDNNGKIVEEIIDGNLSRGFHQRRISTEGLNAGAYYLKLNFRNEEQITKKVIKNN